MTSLCSTATPSLFRISTKESLVQDFSFPNLTRELQLKAPFLYKLLLALSCSTSSAGHINLKTKESQYITVIMIASIIVRERNMHMNAVQYVLGILLWHGLALKEVGSG